MLEYDMDFFVSNKIIAIWQCGFICITVGFVYPTKFNPTLPQTMRQVTKQTSQ